MKTAMEQLLCDVFRAQGLRSPDAAARRAVEGYEAQRRAERIYEYRVHHTEAETAETFGISAIRVRQIVRQVVTGFEKIA